MGSAAPPSVVTLRKHIGQRQRLAVYLQLCCRSDPQRAEMQALVLRCRGIPELSLLQEELHLATARLRSSRAAVWTQWCEQSWHHRKKKVYS